VPLGPSAPLPGHADPRGNDDDSIGDFSISGTTPRHASSAGSRRLQGNEPGASTPPLQAFDPSFWGSGDRSFWSQYDDEFGGGNPGEARLPPLQPFSAQQRAGGTAAGVLPAEAQPIPTVKGPAFVFRRGPGAGAGDGNYSAYGPPATPPLGPQGRQGRRWQQPSRQPPSQASSNADSWAESTAGGSSVGGAWDDDTYSIVSEGYGSAGSRSWATR